ncbi:supwaprin-a [Nematostella vectensis]|uniref:supwaprin-a n=1 Tax=Nematostella vectensis TaxID=45351 RepID=UPI00207788F9|nr:supwaprin-a [Nematostella vectensis]
MASLPRSVMLVLFLALWTLAQGQTTPVTCPTFPPPDECRPDPDDECKNDSQCLTLYPGLGLKCCKKGCDFRCVAPVRDPAPTVRPTTTAVCRDLFTKRSCEPYKGYCNGRYKENLKYWCSKTCGFC